MNTEVQAIIRGNPRLQRLIEATHEGREAARNHGVFAGLRELEDVRAFMEHHVFAVWDFMTLAKALQRSLTCVDLPWVPRGDRLSRRLINEIVLEEESDEDGRGGTASHFEIYLEAMREAGADAGPIDALLASLGRSADLPTALRACGAPPAARDFVARTWEIASSGAAHRVAAAFALGREEIIPEMFYEVVWKVRDRFPGRLGRFVYYLERHINVDGDRHAPLALRMIAQLCGSDERAWGEAEAAARQAVAARLALWDGLAAARAAKEGQAC